MQLRGRLRYNAGVFDQVFQFLFKYPALVFEQGEFAFAMSRSMALAALVVGAAAIAGLITYRGIKSEGPVRERTVLVLLRLALVAVLLFCLVRPTLVLRAAVPQQNFLGILIDDSRSMTITDSDGVPRTTFIQEQLGDPDGPLAAALADKFVLRLFRFSRSMERLESTGDLGFEGTASRLGTALERARDELSGLPLAGLVMVTDGADTSDASLDELLASLKARSIPVFTVGVGRERFERDIEITRVETPRSILKGTSITVDAFIRHTGYAGRTVALQVEDEGRIISAQQVELPRDGESATVRVNFTATEDGPHLFRFRVPPQADEQVTQNNARDTLIEVTDVRERVLYLSGEPRSEVAFFRRHVAEDENLEVVILQRTAEDKYLRLDVGNPDELVGGFPKTREELFAYRGIVLSSVEAASFSPEQLRMLAEFVSKRGGGLLMVGGRRSFAEGGWAGTPLAEVLPVELEDPAGENFIARLTVRPTLAGEDYPITRLGESEEDSTTSWDVLPELSTVNRIGIAKRGATVLLTGTDEVGDDHIVLAFQRYGRGKALAFPIQDSWIWQMDATIPLEDTTFATFWRRMIRWLVDGVPEHVEITALVDRVEPGETLRLRAEVVDPAFEEVNDATVTAQVTSPSGRVIDVPMEWTVSTDGEYRGSFLSDEPGLYEVRGSAVRQDADLGAGVMYARASAGDTEYFDATMRASLLTRIAEETGGRFFTPADASTLPEAISYSGRGVTVVEERDLWDMPILLIMILGLIGCEWGYRRLRGLA